MKYNPAIHHRTSVRLKEYDYSQPGEYFVTLCTHEKVCVFGEVVEDEVQLTPMGEIAKRCWEEIPKHFPNVELDEHVVMPNHIHGIIVLNDHGRDVQLNVPTRLSPRRGSLSVIIRTYKAAVTAECRDKKYSEFRWQSRFYDHVIRDGQDLDRIREYIIENPIKWYLDENNPNRPAE
jgi:REP element-mobilizing transposase RayT